MADNKIDSRGAVVPVREVKTYYKVRLKGHGGGCVFESKTDALAEIQTLLDEECGEAEMFLCRMDPQAFERLQEFDGDYS